MFSLRTLSVLLSLLFSFALFAGDDTAKTEDTPITYRKIEVEGWTVQINERLDKEEKVALEKMLPLLSEQLQLIIKLVPAEPLKHLQKVTLWINPQYPGIQAKAEYHPGAVWLRANHRDAQMAKGVEITNVKNFDFEIKRMPVLLLHELSHAYHDQVLGFSHPQIIAAYKQAVENKSYDKVERINGPGRKNSMDRAYAMTNEREYFAENTEAFFAQNDFYPFNREELEKHDPTMFKLLQEIWKSGPDAK